MSRIALLFGVHAHQPAGNFPEVVETAHLRCYQPFLRTVAEYPEFRFAAHFSGPLLAQLEERYPDDMQLLRDMAARGQVEMVGAGDTEPVLAAIPHRDRVAQIEALSARLARRYGQRPSGAWLTERVWESAVVTALAECGIRYTLVDDYHFLATGRTLAELDGYYTTEESGTRLDLFPISEALRYRIPFSPAGEAVSYIESLAQADRRCAAVYFDDIEKFGIWPETHEWVYGRRWLRDFIEAVLRSPAIETLTYAGFHASTPTRGPVYLPTTSYIEMNEWSLPASAASEYAALIEEAKAGGGFDARKGFLRGGIWRNFFSRYPESNWMHKRMLELSARLDALSSEKRTPALTELLHLSQANDAYWHGLFGGLYLPHLRRNVYRSLVDLEAQLDAASPRPACERRDIDLDGHEELLLRSDAVQAIVRMDGHGALCELDSYELKQNFGDTLRRHAEHYHERARRGAEQAHAGEGIASAHDRVAFKHEILPEHLEPDLLPRGMFIDRCATGSYAATAVNDWKPESAQDTAAFQLRTAGLTAAKSYRVEGNTVAVRYTLDAAKPGSWGTTLDVAMPSCDGYAGRHMSGGNILGGLGQDIDLPVASELTLDDRYMNGSFTVRCTPPARIRATPYRTVSQSEEGFERVMQSVTVELDWPLKAGKQDCIVELIVAAG